MATRARGARMCKGRVAFSCCICGPHTLIATARRESLPGTASPLALGYLFIRGVPPLSLQPQLLALLLFFHPCSSAVSTDRPCMDIISDIISEAYTLWMLQTWPKKRRNTSHIYIYKTQNYVRLPRREHLLGVGACWSMAPLPTEPHIVKRSMKSSR
jgi:hypothetical protein